MTRSKLVVAPILLCSLLAPALASAAPEGSSEFPEPAAAAEASAPAEEAVTVAPPAEAPVAAEVAEPDIVEAEIVDDYAPPPYDPDPYDTELYETPEETYESRRTTMKLDSGYVSLGIAPGMTFHNKGFHPNTRFELEFGGTLEHDFRDLALSFGVVTHITPYYERKQPSFGADVTATALLGPVYIRTGLGALGGLPRQHMLHQTAAAVGGVVGAGLSFGRAPMIRVGVDYDLRLNTRGELVHTGFLVLRLVCCRKD